MANHTASFNQRVGRIADAASSKASDAFDTASEKVSDAFNATVDYVRGNSASGMWDDVQDYVRAHPAQALLAAAAAGFVAARLMRRS